MKIGETKFLYIGMPYFLDGRQKISRYSLPDIWPLSVFLLSCRAGSAHLCCTSGRTKRPELAPITQTGHAHGKFHRNRTSCRLQTDRHTHTDKHLSVYEEVPP